MAGDHKCPVCPATFTRPQHVARHMRSHTGDRPYKCSICGDQFARSDLLSRHVNKCHNADKQGTTTRRRPARNQQTRTVPALNNHTTASQPDLRQPRTSHRPSIDGSKTDASAASSEESSYAYGVPLSVPSMSLAGSSLYQPSPVAPQFQFNYHESPRQPSLSLSTGTAESTDSPNDMLHLLSGGGPIFNPSAGAGQPAFAWPQQQPYQGGKVTNDSSLLPSSYLDQPSLGPNPDYNSYNQAQQTYAFPPLNAEPRADLPSVANQSSSRVPLPSDYSALGDLALAQSLPSSHPYSTSSLSSRLPYNGQADPYGFSSAFGLMSLDDPAVLAGIANDGPQFFSNTNNSRDQGTSALGSSNNNTNNHYVDSVSQSNRSFFPHGGLSPHSMSLNTPTREDNVAGRDAEINDLREFWSAFMRDPTPRGTDPSQYPFGTPSAQTPLARPNLRHSLSKTTSMPAIKRPSFGPSDSFYHPRSTHNNPESLRSYEQAILARKAPTLNMVPKPRNHKQSIGGEHGSPNQQPAQLDSPVFRYGPSPAPSGSGGSRPSTSGGVFEKPLVPSISGRPLTASSNASRPSSSYGTQGLPPMNQSGPPQSPPDSPAQRPNYKRLPSQTLGPAQSKRTYVPPPGWEEDSDLSEAERPRTGGGYVNHGFSRQDSWRHERRRSEPSAARPLDRFGRYSEGSAPPPFGTGREGVARLETVFSPGPGAQR